MARIIFMSLSMVALGLFSIEASSMMLSRAARSKNCVRNCHQHARHKSSLRQLKASDPVRQFQHALKHQDVGCILTHGQYAGFCFPDGSNSLVSAKKYINPPRQQEIINFLMMNGANPYMPDLVTLQTAAPWSKQFGGLTHRPENYARFFYPLIVATKSLLTKSEHDTIDEFVHIYKAVRAASNEEAAQHEFMKFLHNGIVFSTSLLVPFFSTPTIEPKQLKQLQYDFKVNNYLAIPTQFLADLGVVKYNAEEEEQILWAQAYVELLTPEFIVKVAHVIVGLMEHAEVKFLRADPERARLLLAGNITDKPLGKLPFEEEHARAERILERAISNH